MLIIHCPFCGPRNEIEFQYGGPANSRRPEDAGARDDDAWRDYLLIPPNPIGPVREKWWHAKGCGCWITLDRHTVTHKVTMSGETEPGNGESR